MCALGMLVRKTQLQNKSEKGCSAKKFFFPCSCVSPFYAIGKAIGSWKGERNEEVHYERPPCIYGMPL